MAMAITAALVLSSASAAADPELISKLKTLGKAVDDMSAHISTAASDADAELLAKVTREAFAKGLTQDRPTIVIEARSGFCRVTIDTPAWRLWSEGREGKIVDHGAKIL
jgi:hypothetical protein